MAGFFIFFQNFNFLVGLIFGIGVYFLSLLAVPGGQRRRNPSLISKKPKGAREFEPIA